MYTKREASLLKQAFWTAFGQYMAPVLSAEGEQINWVNYKTGEKDIYFRMEADNNAGTISITLTHPDAALQALYFQQFKQLGALLNDALHEAWVWQPHTTDEYGKTISLIYTRLTGVNIFNKADWPQLISFFKPRIIALDAFWSDAKYAFENLP